MSRNATSAGLSDRLLSGLGSLAELEVSAGAHDSANRRKRSESIALKGVMRALNVSTGALFLFETQIAKLVVAVCEGEYEHVSIQLSAQAVRDLGVRQEVVCGTAPTRALVRLNRMLVDAGLDLWVPLAVGEDVCGVIALGASKCCSEDATVLRLLARHVAILLHSRNLSDHNNRTTFKLNRKVLELETVYDAGLALSASLQVDDVIEEILELAVGVVDGRSGFLFLKHPRSGRANLVHQVGLDNRLDMLTKPDLRKYVRRVLKDLQSLHLDPSMLEEGFAETGVIVAPVGDVGCIGVIDKESRTGTQPFGEADARLLELIGQQAGAALANARLYRDIVEIKNQNENILSSIGNGVISTDLKGKITQYNPAVVRIFGKNAPQVGKSCARFFAGFGCRNISAAVTLSLKDGKSRQIEGEEVEGVGVTLDCRITPLSDETGAVMGIVVTLEDLTAEMRVRTMFKQYASDQVVDLLLADASTPSLGGEEREVTVLFVDIRQSTTLLGRIGPEGMLSLLNDCFARMNEIIFDHNGTLDKYTGDGFMVVYGAPVSFDDDTERAVKTAVEMQKELARFNRGKVEPLPLAFGMSRGRVVAGNVGSLRRMEYTCIGPGVVRASRLCDAAEGGEILIDQTVYDVLSGNYQVAELGWRRFKGVDPIQVYRIEAVGKSKSGQKDPEVIRKLETMGERFVDLTIPMLPEMELAATRTAEAVASFAGLSGDKTEEVKLALIEACINAFEHSRSKDQVVRINFKIDTDALTILISDSGHGFDIDQARAKVAEKREQGIATRGWGLRIMEELMDEVRIESGAKGTVITLVKQR